MKVICVVGARPNFMKMAPLHRALEANHHDSILVHTGQHYAPEMSGIFFSQLKLPSPRHHLGVGSASHAVQTARIMEAFEPVLEAESPAGVLVAGDVNSTIACALVAVKHGIRVAHLEAGLRSFDRTMPEEINRILTDSISDLLLTPSRDATANLIREGIADDRIVFVGNAMIDTLLEHLPKARSLQTCQHYGVKPGEYALVTLHRPSNVDESASLMDLLKALTQLSHSIPVLFPVHPRTTDRIVAFGLEELLIGMQILPPLGYLEFLGLECDAKFVVTDSGGIQEETTVLGIPCLTVRNNTERPITVGEGTNVLVGTDAGQLLEHAGRVLRGEFKQGRIPEYWDGHAGHRSAIAIVARWTK